MDQSYQEQQSPAPYTEFFSWGSDSYGQLALANSDEDDRQQQHKQRNAFYDQPKSLSFDILISQISCGDYHAAFISGDGFVFSVGRNTEGQLGVGDSSLLQSSAPLLIDSLPKSQPFPKVLKCGSNHTAVIMDNGELYTWGEGQYGALGQSSLQNAFSPVQVLPQNDKYCQFANIDCGKRNTMAIDIQGRIYVCGENQYRQLGIPNKDQVNALTMIQDFNEKIKNVALGNEHSLVQTVDDRIFACGNNSNGNLGLGHSYSSDNFLQVHGLVGQKVKQIEAGRHSAAITIEGRLYVWGPVFKGESNLLLPQELRSSKLMKQISIGEKDSIVIDQDNQLYSWGTSHIQASNANQMPTLIEALASKVITQVNVGLDFFVALGQDFNENEDPIDNVLQNNLSPIQYNHDQAYVKQDYQSQYFDQKSQKQSYSPYQASKEINYGSRDNLNKSQTEIGKPPIQSIDSKPQIHIYDQKKDNSMISSNSSRSKDPTFQYSHIQTKPTESDQSFQHQQHSTITHDRYQPLVSPGGTKSEGRVTNADLYRQLDVVKEENHQLKQKNRELMQKVNQYKVENENIITNADSEIKRMSEFIDQYTLEVESTKKQFEDDLQQKLSHERRMNEDLKQKMHQGQNELDAKLDHLQREIERLRRENMQLSQERTESQNKNRFLAEQLEVTQHKMNQLQVSSQQQQNPRDYTTISPISTSKQHDRYPTTSYQNHYSRTPNNLHSHQMNTGQQSRTQEYQNKEQSSYNQQLSTNVNVSVARESQTPLINAQKRRGVSPADFSPIPNSYDQQQSIEYQRHPQSYPRQKESEHKERQSPQRIANLLGLKSPIREGIAHEVLQPTDYHKGRDDYSYDDSRISNQRNSFKPQHKHDEDQAYSYNERSHPTKSPMKGLMDEAYEVHQKLQHQLQNSSSNYSPSVYRREEQSSIIKGSDKESPALNDVKNRLAAMQRNKEELEEKLRNYEAKIRQHFNR